MALFTFANNVQTELASPISSTTTTIPLTSSANFPTIPAGYVWAVTLNDRATGLVYEIVYVTATSGANLTVLRGQEGTTAQAWLANDYAFAAATAGALNGFVETPTLAGFVQLNPLARQTGSINISGNIVAAGTGTFLSTLSVMGAAAFASYVQAVEFYSTLPYGATPINNLPLAFNSVAGGTYVGASSSLSSQGIFGSMLTIASYTGNLVVFDTAGNIATGGSLKAQNGLFLGEVAGTSVFNNGNPCLTTLSSSTLVLTRTSDTNYDIEYPTTLPVGTGFINDGNGGSPTITLPNYGAWFIEVFYGLQQTSNNNLLLVLALSGGTITGGFLSNANSGVPVYNSVAYIMLYGKGRTTINNQTLTFSLSATSGTLDPTHQPWTVRATRTA